MTGNGHQVDKVFVFSTASPHAPPKKVSVEEVGYEVQRLACKAKRRSYNHCSISDAGVAQWLERHVANVNVVGSNPITRSLYTAKFKQHEIMRFARMIFFFGDKTNHGNCSEHDS